MKGYLTWNPPVSSHGVVPQDKMNELSQLVYDITGFPTVWEGPPDSYKSIGVTAIMYRALTLVREIDVIRRAQNQKEG